MIRTILITFLLSYCAAFFSQTIYSREFEARKKNVPLAIINNNPNFFYLLRYNKAAHDINIERRANPSAEILSFTPLKLDSVNAKWYDYEKFDYLFFEQNYHVYFLFEKILNSKKSLFLKITDTLGKASGFIELASIEREKGVTDVNFEFKRTNNNSILIIASQTYGVFGTKKLALLFDIEKRKVVWIKKMPFENSNTGYSTAFECNESNDFFYVLVKAHLASFKRKNIHFQQVLMPTLHYDSLKLVSFVNGNSFLIKKNIEINNLSALDNLQLVSLDKDLIVSVYFSKRDSLNNLKTYFLNQRFNNDLSNQIYSVVSLLDSVIEECLTFYDGTDFKEPGEKEFQHFANYKKVDFNYEILERVEDYYYKELLVWRNDFKTGKISKQKIIPRKVYSFKGRTRYKSVGIAMPFLYKQNLHVVVLESPLNINKNPNDFNYHRFKKETNLWKSHLILYKINDKGILEKKLIYHNSNFDAVPMSYQTGNQEDFIFYLNNGKTEKFAILNLNQL